MTIPAERLANDLEILAAMLRHPSGKTDEHFRQVFEHFNEQRNRYPALLTDDELRLEISRLHNEFEQMAYGTPDGTQDMMSDRLQSLKAELEHRNA